jgi:hypothetical protein
MVNKSGGLAFDLAGADTGVNAGVNLSSSGDRRRGSPAAR